MCRCVPLSRVALINSSLWVHNTIEILCFATIKKIKEIEEKWDNIGLPSICFIISKNDKYYVLAYLAADDYYPFYFKMTPVEDVVLADEKEEQFLCDELKPKVLQVLTNYVTIELRGNKYKIPRYEYLKELKAK